MTKLVDYNIISAETQSDKWIGIWSLKSPKVYPVHSAHYHHYIYSSLLWYQTEPIQGSQITSSCAYLLWQQVPYVPYYTITNSPLALLLLHIKTLPTHFSSHLDGTDIVAQECLFQLRQTFATNFRHILQQYNKEFLNPCVYYFHSIHVVA